MMRLKYPMMRLNLYSWPDLHEFLPRVEGDDEHKEHEMEIERGKVQTHTNTVSGYPSRARITHPIESQRERLARQMIEL